MAASRRKKPKRKQPRAASDPLAAKQPRHAFHPEAKKVPVAKEKRDYWQYHPRWRFGLLDLGGTFGWDHIDSQEVRNLHNKLCNYEQKTWNEIFLREKHWNHSVKQDQLCSEAIKRLRDLKLDDHEQFWSLRLNSTQRVWGLLVDDVFYLLWWDPDHQVCPSRLKGT